MAAACSDDGSDDGDDPGEQSAPVEEQSTTTESEPTTTTVGAVEIEIPDDPEEAVEVSYRAAMEAQAASMNPPDPDHPELLATWSQPMLDDFRGVLEGLDAEGAAMDIEFEDQVVLSVHLVDDNYAQVVGCEIRVRQRLEDGEPVDDSERFLTLTNAGLARDEETGVWRLVSMSQDVSDSSVASCEVEDDGTGRYDG